MAVDAVRHTRAPVAPTALCRADEAALPAAPLVSVLALLRRRIVVALTGVLRPALVQLAEHPLHVAWAPAALPTAALHADAAARLAVPVVAGLAVRPLAGLGVLGGARRVVAGHVAATLAPVPVAAGLLSHQAVPLAPAGGTLVALRRRAPVAPPPRALVALAVRAPLTGPPPALAARLGAHHAMLAALPLGAVITVRRRLALIVLPAAVRLAVAHARLALPPLAVAAARLVAQQALVPAGPLGARVADALLAGLVVGAVRRVAVHRPQLARPPVPAPADLHAAAAAVSALPGVAVLALRRAAELGVGLGAPLVIAVRTARALPPAPAPAELRAADAAPLARLLGAVLTLGRRTRPGMLIGALVHLAPHVAQADAPPPLHAGLLARDALPLALPPGPVVAGRRLALGVALDAGGVVAVDPQRPAVGPAPLVACPDALEALPSAALLGARLTLPVRAGVGVPLGAAGVGAVDVRQGALAPLAVVAAALATDEAALPATSHVSRATLVLDAGVGVCGGAAVVVAAHAAAARSPAPLAAALRTDHAAVLALAHGVAVALGRRARPLEPGPALVPVAVDLAVADAPPAPVAPAHARLAVVPALLLVAVPTLGAAALVAVKLGALGDLAVDLHRPAPGPPVAAAHLHAADAAIATSALLAGLAGTLPALIVGLGAPGVAAADALDLALAPLAPIAPLGSHQAALVAGPARLRLARTLRAQVAEALVAAGVIAVDPSVALPPAAVVAARPPADHAGDAAALLGPGPTGDLVDLLVPAPLALALALAFTTVLATLALALALAAFIATRLALPLGPGRRIVAPLSLAFRALSALTTLAGLLVSALFIGRLRQVRAAAEEEEDRCGHKGRAQGSECGGHGSS